MNDTGHGGRRPGAGRKPGGGDDTHKRLTAAKMRKEESLASLRELQLARACGDVIALDTVISRWSDILITVRQRLLSIPSKAAAVCAGRSTGEIEAILKREVHDVLNELAQAPDYSTHDGGSAQ